MDRQWKAKWITEQQFRFVKPIDVFSKEHDVKPEPQHRADLTNIHTMFRKSFQLQQLPQATQLYITADDYYKLYVNGQFVGQGPAQANYYHYFYNTYDITPYLQQGENVIAVHVYYHGLISRSYNSGDHRQGMIAELHIDGNYMFGTDSSWKYRAAAEYKAGPIIGYNTQFSEFIDSRLKQKGWRTKGFDDSRWLSASAQLADDHILFQQPTPTLSVYTVKPQLVTAIDGGYVLDFGSELTGQFTMTATGQAGQEILIRCGEELLPDARVRYEMRCNCTYEDRWILSGEREKLELYDYKAFRYVEVFTDAIDALEVDSFAAIVRHYPLNEQACQFQSSNELLNSIWEICKNGLKYGTQENYVDCPSREKGQYLGDNTIITHAHAYVSGDLRMYRKALQDFALMSARVCPGIMAVAPGHFMQEIADFSLQYPMQLLQYYRLSGDKEFVSAMYPVAQQIISHFTTFCREDGLLQSVDDKWNLVDWPENLRDGYDFELKRQGLTGCHNVVNAYYFGALKSMHQIGVELDLSETTYTEQIQIVHQSFINTFYDHERRLMVDAEGSQHASLHANVLPLLFGCCPEEAIPSIVNLIKAKRLSCGVYMSYFVLKALAEAKQYELLYELIVSDDLHSWSTMVKEGATTCFEAWSKDLKWNTSLCHPWASAPIPLLIEEICGIKPATPGWTQVSFNPYVPSSLSSLKLSFQTVVGEITFEHADGHSKLTVPDGVEIV